MMIIIINVSYLLTTKNWKELARFSEYSVDVIA